MKTESVYVYGAFNRFWHWTQAGLILLLALTGFEIHGSWEFLGYAAAVSLHNAAAVGLLVLIVFAIFWHVTTGEWRQYVPTRRLLRAQLEYYVIGIFNDAAHPTRKTVMSKLNPLQKLAYAGLKVMVIPVMGLTGLVYMFYRYPQRHNWTAASPHGLENVAALHTLGAFLLIAFVIGHVYLATTGHTLFSNLRAMLTGYETLHLHPEPATESELEEAAGAQR